MPQEPVFKFFSGLILNYIPYGLKIIPQCDIDMEKQDKTFLLVWKIDLYHALYKDNS